MTRTYADLRPTFPDRADWTLPRVLRTRAAEQTDAVILETPAEQRRWTYGQMLAEAEAVAGAFVAAGAETRDRVLIMAANSSQFIRTWFGTAFAGLVEVPINTAYSGDFLTHQVKTTA